MGVFPILGIVLLSPVFAFACDLRNAEEALERNDFSAAATDSAACLKSEHQNSSAHIILARARMGQNDAIGALNELESALNINPRDVDALYYTNKLTSVLARQELARLYEISPDSGRVHQLMAESSHAQDDSASEEREYREALQRMPDSVPILTALGDLTRYNARYEESVLYYSRAERLDRRNFNALYGLGASALFQEHYRAASEYMRRALQVEPKSEAARLGLGDALLRDQQYEEAVKVLARLVKEEPTEKQGWALYGKALRQAGHTAQADIAFAHYRHLSGPGSSPP